MVQLGLELFPLCISPIIGLLLSFTLKNKKIRGRILYANLLILSPILFGWIYDFNFIPQGAGIITFSIFFSFLIDRISSKVFKIMNPIFSSLALAFILGYLAFLDAFSGSTTVDKTWQFNTFRVEYIIDQGFAGGPALYYDLRKNALIPFLSKKIDTNYRIENEGCIIEFKENTYVFDSCKNSLTKSK